MCAVLYGNVIKYRIRSLKRTLLSISVAEITENRRQFKNYIYLITTIMVKIEEKRKKFETLAQFIGYSPGRRRVVNRLLTYILLCALSKLLMLSLLSRDTAVVIINNNMHDG